MAAEIDYLSQRSIDTNKAISRNTSETARKKNVSGCTWMLLKRVSASAEHPVWSMACLNHAIRIIRHHGT